MEYTCTACPSLVNPILSEEEGHKNNKNKGKDAAPINSPSETPTNSVHIKDTTQTQKSSFFTFHNIRANCKGPNRNVECCLRRFTSKQRNQGTAPPLPLGGLTVHHRHYRIKEISFSVQ